MKQLILMRHAKSSWKDPTLEDFDRPLGNRGLRDAPVMADRLARAGLTPDLVVSSPARRAVATAHLVAPVVGSTLHAIVMEPGIYEASAGELLAIVQRFDDSYSQVLMFGHNPGFTLLAETLGDAVIGNLPTSGVAWLSFEATHWPDVGPGTGTLLKLDYPKRTDA